MSGDKDMQFVDTNILVYAYDSSSGKKHEIAKMLLKQLWVSKTGCLSVQVLQEFYVTITRKTVFLMDSYAATKVVEDFSKWQLFTPNAADVLGAIRIENRNQLSFWDAMIIRAASESGCMQLFSEDYSHGANYEGVRVINPFL